MTEQTRKDKTNTEIKPYQPPPPSQTEHTGTIGGRKLRYVATADWVVVRKDERPQAEVFFVHYSLAGKRSRRRPVTFLFNGGPGAASAYLHVGAVGPWRVEFMPNGTYAGPPVSLVDNAESWLPFTDLVFIDPVGTGFSRAVEESRNEREPFRFEKGDNDDLSKLFERADNARREFFKLNRDLECLNECITKILSAFSLWESPVFLVGESYGGFRVGKLVRLLQENGGVGLSGAILVSPALDLTARERSDYDVVPWIDEFPSMGLAALFHRRSQSPGKNDSLNDVKLRLEQFVQDYMSVFLVSGDAFSGSKRSQLFRKMANLLGLSEEYITSRDGRVPFWAFARELLRDKRLMCGYYDSACTTIDPFPDRESYEGPDATLSSLEKVFSSGINAVLRSRLKVKTDREYCTLSIQVFHQWTHDQWRHLFETQINAVDDLRYGIVMNPFLKVLIAHGYYDLVTPYFSSQRLVNLMKLTHEQRRLVRLQNFMGGHMFYTWTESRRSFTRSVRQLYL